MTDHVVFPERLTRLARLAAVGLVVWLGSVVSAAAGQSAPGPADAVRITVSSAAVRRALSALPGEGAQQPAGAGVGAAAGDRACAGCPERRVGLAVAEALGVNVLYNMVNRLRPAEERVFFQVTPKSWWENLRYGFEWDDNNFGVNQIGHPYQGNNYYTAGRANGLSFWESAPLAALGSATWEYFGEKHRASVNDLINTTLGGIALGEMLHRAAWLVRDTRVTGRPRLMQEIAGAAIDPVGGAHRFVYGDASRVSEKPATMVPPALATYGSAGVLWQGIDTRARESTGEPYVDLDLRYGETRSGRSRTPYDAFTVAFRFGGGGAVSRTAIRGRLLGQPLGPDGQYQLTVVQAYDYISNEAYQIGGQSALVAVTTRRPLSSSASLELTGFAGVVVLGAIDSVIQRGEDRDYDYGPGSQWGGAAAVLHRGIQLARISYRGVQLFVVDGARANHLLQEVAAELTVPIRGRLGIGIASEYLSRKTFFLAGGQRDQSFPRFRAFLVWRPS